ncbi:PHP domain-containing protein [Omnitrophica bacterium]|nr:PHP domain-containing protein [Candidatus Omnitrophota bacterium]
MVKEPLLNRTDLHLHSSHSDGKDSPAELMRYCRQKGLTTVSLTDHDTVSGYAEALREAKTVGIECICGVELSLDFEPGTLHLLGYFLDPENTKLQEALLQVQEARRERNPQIIEKLNRLGMDISLDEVRQEAFSASPEVQADERQIGRPHFARVLVRKGAVKRTEEAFDRYLGKGRPAYVPKKRLSSAQAIDVIRRAGGVSSLAHPNYMALGRESLELKIAELKEGGLDAIEVYHSSHDRKDRKFFKKMASKFDLAETGGSDFHGNPGQGVDAGDLGQGVALGPEIIERLRSRIRQPKA